MRTLLILLFLIPFSIFGQSADSLTRTELTKVYSLAISDYIKAVYKEQKIRFDTLYFGKHDQFPNIKLPATIEHTAIKIVSPEEGMNIQKQRKSSYFINMVGWGDKSKYEFMLVTFSNNSEHQFDGLSTYKYSTKLKTFELDKLRFEYFLHLHKK